MKHVCFFILISCFVAACDKEKQAEENRAEQSPQPAQQQAKGSAADLPKDAKEGAADEASAGPVATGKGYKLSASLSEGFQRGQEARLLLRLDSQGEFHINHEFPFEITPRATEGVAFAAKRFQRTDAEEFGESNAVFRLPFTASAGAKEVRVHVSFAVCTPENCMPDEKVLSVPLPE